MAGQAGARPAVSTPVISIETAVISWAGANGLAMITLSGTPLNEHSWPLLPKI